MMHKKTAKKNKEKKSKYLKRHVLKLEKERINYEKVLTALRESEARFKQLCLVDPDTGLYNYHYLVKIIEAEFHRARRYVHPLSVIMMDIDYFKSINDFYGYKFGDMVLRQLVKQLKKLVRRYDIIIRFGGEEFVIISPGIDRLQAINLAQRILDAINVCNFGNHKNSVKLKLSLAVVSYPQDRAIRGIKLIDFAEQGLAKAKESGGNRIYSYAEAKKYKNQGAGKNNSSPKFLNIQIDKLTKRSNQSLAEAIFAFAKAIELKDHYTGKHVENTVRYATGIARELVLSREEVELIRQAAMLHDLGKIGISEKILLKPGKLTKKEFKEIKKHPQIGADIIRPIHFMHPLIPFIFYHHERWDGKGYPVGLKGEDIPIGARIIAIADVYEALVSDRPYRKAYLKEEAVKMIKEGAGTQFDYHIVVTFLKILQKEKK